jgi:hypothetical protein
MIAASSMKTASTAALAHRGATRYDKLARNYLACICLAAALV